MSERLFLLSLVENGKTVRATLFIWTLHPRIKRPSPSAHAFLESHPQYEMLRTVADRLKWCRCHKNLTQKEVDSLLCAPFGTWRDLERGTTFYLLPNLSGKIGALFDIPKEDLLDPYQAFLEQGQGSVILRIREHLNLTRQAFASKLGIRTNILTRWENEEKIISRGSWERYFQDLTADLEEQAGKGL